MPTLEPIRSAANQLGSESSARPKVVAIGASVDSMAWAYVRRVIEGFACPKRLATVRMSWPSAMDIVADQCRRSCRRHLGSTLAASRARRHHVDTRSGLAGVAPAEKIQGPYRAKSILSSSSAESVVVSSVITLRFAVLVGSSRSVGFDRELV